MYSTPQNLLLTVKKKAAITEHLKSIFEINELEENSVVSIMEITADDGKEYRTKVAGDNTRNG
jgi:hypothetical protein